MNAPARRSFMIRDAKGCVVGAGVEQGNGEVEARFPVSLDGVRIGGELSRWEDAEVATWAIEAMSCSVEWLDGVLTGDWAHDYWVYFPHGDPLGLGTGYEYCDANNRPIEDW